MNHPTPGLATRLLALRLLERVDCEGAWVSRMISAEIARQNLSADDAALLRYLVQTVLRQRPALDFVIRSCARRGRVAEPVKRVLEVGLAQLLFLDRIPDHAAVDLAARSARRVGLHRQVGLINGLLRRVARERPTWLDRIASEGGGQLLGPAPTWLYKRWQERLGADAAATLHRCLGAPAAVEVRIDDRSQDWASMLGAEQVHAEPLCLRLPGGMAPAALPGLALGAWSVQDRNAARIVPLLPSGGARVADLCAAPGGKTVQLARRFASAELCAFELHPKRAELVRETLQRCGLKGAVSVGDATELAAQQGPFDRISLDAPCSGLGTLRRHPEIAGRAELKQLESHHQLQWKLLEAGLGALRTGGFLVYSVCSLEPEEGDQVIQRALALDGIRLAQDPRLPTGTGFFGLDGDGDGFFVALLEKS